MTTIKNVFAREVLDSRGRPTVEVEIELAGGFSGRAIVPSGASTGSAEALELRDGDPARYDKMGVLQAVEHVNRLVAQTLLGADATDQAAIDARLLELDGTPQKTQLGGNTLLGASLAAAHAAAAALNLPLYRHLHQLWAKAAERAGLTAVDPPRLPLPMTNMISGGLHAGGNLDLQDVLVMPIGAPDYPTGLEWIVRVYRRLGNLLSRAGFEGYLVGDEGGYGPRLSHNRQAMDFVVQAIVAAGLEPGRDMAIALDVAATHFFDGKNYRLAAEGDLTLSSDEMLDLVERWLDGLPIVSLEDLFAEDDWSAWQQATRRWGDRLQLVGDDLLATRADRVQRAAELGAANAALIKVNQVGTLSETFHTMAAARRAGFRLVVSARSGETEDTTIADLAVATAAEQIKIGSVARSERLAKYNRLLRIAEQFSDFTAPGLKGNHLKG